jgi:hypothetical protein
MRCASRRRPAGRPNFLPALSACSGIKDAVGVSTLNCISPIDGQRFWSTPIPMGAIGPSLASNRDTVLVMREYSGASAFDKRTRQARWSITFNSVRVPPAFGTEMAFLPGHGLRAVSLKDGSAIWEKSGAPVPFASS